MFERYRCAHHGLPRQVGEAGFGPDQEAFGHVQPSVFGQIDEVFYQVAPVRLGLVCASPRFRILMALW